jgi:hypothetical protein
MLARRNAARARSAQNPPRRRTLAPRVDHLESRQLLATFAVWNRNAAGPGSLRAAILRANKTPGADTIEFKVAGTIRLDGTSLPAIVDTVTIDGTKAPGYAGTPVVNIDFRGTKGLRFERGADGSAVEGLALVRAGGAAVTLAASRVTVAGNYIGLWSDGKTPGGNRGDGVRIVAGSRGNLIGHSDPVSSVSYFNADAVSMQPVSGWQGIRDADTAGQYLITGTSNDNGLLYVGPINGSGGTSYAVNYPGAIATSVYGPDNLDGGRVRLVGTYRTGDDIVRGFVFEGTTDDLANPDNYRTIAVDGAQFTYVHSTMGGLAVGNYDGPTSGGEPVGPGRCFIYDVATGQFLTDIVFPGSISNTAYGIWYNGGTSYTICGGFSKRPVNNLENQGLPIGMGSLVDYDAATGQFSHWKSFVYPRSLGNVELASHFEGLSSAEKGVYTLSAGTAQLGASTGEIGSYVTVRRNADGSFGDATWVDLSYPSVEGGVTSNSVAGNQVVGIVLADTGTFSYQATVNIGFQLSNVISSNGGNGVGIYGSHENQVAMNYIGTDATGTLRRGNKKNGILVTDGAQRNRIGGQATGGNDPTAGVLARPPQGNLISANGANGVLLNGRSGRTTLSGNFVGTSASGNSALGNHLDGVAIVHSDRNALIGCTFQQSPFVFYNVLSGNGGNGLRINDSNRTTVHANFLGVGADNATIVANRGNGLLVSGTSKNTQVGGVIPLGNVISGNDRNGIEVRDKASGFTSFNTFAGIYAFGGAAPNRRNGILITSSGGDNLIRTCIVSGNLGHGIELSGDATGVQVTDTAIGTNTRIDAAIPNGGSGIKIAGRAHHNAIGGFQPSVEPRVTISANRRYGIEVVDSAHHNLVIHSFIGTDATGGGDLGNKRGGIYLGRGTSWNKIGGTSAALRNTIANSGGTGVSIVSSHWNSVVGNRIVDNTGFGVFASGVCTVTVIGKDTIASNTKGNVNIANARGVLYFP